MTMLSPSEDLRDWVVDNWFTIEDCIGFALQTMIVDSKERYFKRYCQQR